MSDSRVLVVDLDGTLIRTDLLHESFWAALGTDLRGAAVAASGILGGRAELKRRLAEWAPLDPADLPYNEEVLEILRAWRKQGRRTVLCTASAQGYADAVAGHLGLFDEVHGSDVGRNLKGAVKATFLRERYGPQGFDYIGDSSADFPVWADARRAISFGLPQRHRRRLDRAAVEAEHHGAPGGDFRAYLRALRPHQWSKNLLVFLPAIADHDFTAATWGAAFLAFAAFCLVASSVYIVNDMLDLAADRAHPRKRARPFASGALPLAHGAIGAGALLVTGLLLATSVGGWKLPALTLAYVGLSTSYSLWLKRKLVIDICALAGLYTLRIVAGGLATGIELSVWFLAFAIFFFLSLAAVKRQAELVDGLATGRKTAAGRAYHVDDLPIVATMALAAGYVSVAVLALYLNSETVQALYGEPQVLWGVCPVLLYWLSRMAMMAHRGSVDDDPIVFALRDRTSWICAALIFALVLVGSLL